jgi:glycine cleavage system aminomethyltransferase T
MLLFSVGFRMPTITLCFIYQLTFLCHFIFLWLCGSSKLKVSVSRRSHETCTIRNECRNQGVVLWTGIIYTGGGIGKVLSEWIYNNGIAPANVDVTSINVNRFHKYQQNEEYRKQRAGEALGETYKVHYPDHQPKTCRNVKQSAIHDRLRTQANAYFRNVSGWESPAWYAPPGIDASVTQESFGRENWFPYWAMEHHACRNHVALFDMTFMSKFLVQGCDAGTFLNFLSTANVDDRCGTITYTQWLNENGYIEADLTVTKLDHDKFLVVATDTMHHHVYMHMMRRLNRTVHAFVTDVTTQYVQLNIQGPASRDLLQRMTTHDMTNANFPFRHVAEIDMGMARVLCMRITYVGELGYELFIPVEYAAYVYDRIIEHGRDVGLQHAGLRALSSLRMEKGYRDYGHDIDNTDTVLEAGLGFTCAFDKNNGGFVGMNHVLAQKSVRCTRGGLKKRMVNVLVNDPEPLMHHGEIIWRNGVRMSDIRSASYGHTVGGAVGLSMFDVPVSSELVIDKDFLLDGKWEVEISNRRYPCAVSFTPFYDGKGERIKV